MNLQTILDREHGLPSNQVHCMAQDDRGRLWLAGPAGLGCYEGSRMRLLDRRHGMQCVGLRSVAVVGAGEIWIGTDLGLEAFDVGGRPLASPAGSSWPFGLVGVIAEFEGGVWLGTSQGVVVLGEPGFGGVRPVAARHEVGFVRDLARWGDSGVVVVSAHLGLLLIDGDQPHRLHHPDLPDSRTIQRVAVTADGGLVVGCSEGLWFIDAQGRPLESIVPSVDVPEVGAIAVDGPHLWVGHGADLVAYERDEAQRWHEAGRSTLRSRINDLHVDPVGNVWVATDNAGVARLSCLRDAIQTIDIGGGAAVYVIKPTAGGDLAIGGERFDGRLHLASTAQGQAEILARLPGTVWDVTADASGEGRWLATNGGLYHAAADAAPQRFDAGHPLLDAPCRVVLMRSDAMWVGTLGGLVRVRNGVAETVLGDGKPLGYVYTLVEDPAGRLWVGTLGRGLWREGANGLEALTGELLSATGNTFVVAPEPGAGSGRILVLQDERMVLIDGQSPPRLLGMEHPVAGWAALWLDADRVAIGGSDGLRIVGVHDGHVERRINALLGANAWEFTTNRTLVRGADDRLYCGLFGGLVAVDLQALQRFDRAPAPALSQVVWQGVEPERRGDLSCVAPGKWSFVAEVFCAWMVDESQVRYRFRLVGFERDWSDLGTLANVRYSSLPPGRYQLQGQVHVALIGFGEVVTLLNLEVVTARSWTWLVDAAAAWYNRTLHLTLRNRTLLDRNRRLEDEITERTKPLAQANEQLERGRQELELRARTDPLTGWINRGEFDQCFALELSRTARSRQPLGILLVDIDHFKLFNDRYGHVAGDDCLRRVTQQLKVALRPYDTAARYGGEEFAILLPGTDAATLTLIGNRLCTSVRASAVVHAGSPLGFVTVSIGGISVQGGVAADLLRAADAALYAAKSDGRNRFVAHAPSTGPAPSQGRELAK